MKQTMNSETDWKIVISEFFYRRLLKKYFTTKDDNLIDQVMPYINMIIIEYWIQNSTC